MGFRRAMRGLWPLGAWVWAACAASVPPEVTSLASHDLACARVDVARVVTDRYAAMGCGKGAVYARVCDAQGCRFGRLRHGHESQLAGLGSAPDAAPAREVLPAPAPEREILEAPPPGPAQRQVLPAPAPEGASEEPAAGTEDEADPAAQEASGAP